MKHSPAAAKFAPVQKGARALKTQRLRHGGKGVKRSATQGEAGGVQSKPAPTARTLGLRALVATTFFVVSGGPYGLEEIVSSHGFGGSLILLLIVPLVWSLPITLLVGELTAALPNEGGYYAWARRALGPFWGVQTAWVALAMSLFDMAIYPMLVVTYLGQLLPALGDTSVGGAGWWAAIVLVALSVFWNLRGTGTVGTTSQWIGVALLLPFVVLVGLVLAGQGPLSLVSGVSQLLRVQPSGDGPALLWLNGLVLCLWNYMGWENASAVAGDVEKPQKTYPRAMFLTVLLVALCYVIPVFCAMAAGMQPSQWSTGGWVEVGRRIGGPYLAVAIALGGALCGLGMFNALVASYSRLPVAMARDGLLPAWFAKENPKTGAPTVSILFAAVLYTACLGLGFKRLVQIDVMLYGALVVIEFVSLVVLRVREPELCRPFRIPGKLGTLICLGLFPTSLLAVSMWLGRDEAGMWGLSSLSMGIVLLLLGPVLYVSCRFLLRRFPALWSSRLPEVPTTKTEPPAYEFST